MAAIVLLHKRRLAICAASAAVYASMMPLVYTAAASLLLEPRRQIVNSGRETTAPPTLDLNRADSELQVIRSERLLSLVFDGLDLSKQSELRPQPPGFFRELLTGFRYFLVNFLGLAVLRRQSVNRQLPRRPVPEQRLSLISGKSPSRTSRNG